MVGVGAISAGISFMLLLLALTVAGFAGLGIGIFLWFRARHRSAVALLLASLGVLAFVAWVSVQTNPPNFPQLTLDVRHITVSALRNPPFHCLEITQDEEICFGPPDIDILQLTLVDGQERKFKAGNLHFAVRGGAVKSLVFWPAAMKGPDLLSLMDAERIGSSLVGASVAEVDAVRHAIEANTVVESDRYLSFKRGAHVISLEIHRRHAEYEPYYLRYEVYFDPEEK